MATGYTADIEKGISFEEYALKCARAFGALIHLRDDQLSSEIPDEIIPSTYHLDCIKETKKELKEIRNTSIEQTDKKAIELHNKRIKENKKYHSEKLELKKKYTEMLLQVNNYQPPSDDHIDLKEFMKEQILSSIKFDCNFDSSVFETPTFISGESWKYETEKSLSESLVYHKKKHKEEIERTEEKNNWINLLVESLEEK